MSAEPGLELCLLTTLVSFPPKCLKWRDICGHHYYDNQLVSVSTIFLTMQENSVLYLIIHVLRPDLL